MCQKVLLKRQKTNEQGHSKDRFSQISVARPSSRLGKREHSPLFQANTEPETGIFPWVVLGSYPQEGFFLFWAWVISDDVSAGWLGNFTGNYLGSTEFEEILLENKKGINLPRVRRKLVLKILFWPGLFYPGFQRIFFSYRYWWFAAKPS